MYPFVSSRPRTRVLPPKGNTARARSWRVSLIRKHGLVLGVVEARSREEAEAAAVRMFGLNKEQRSRLVVQARI
jgi:hypothetical protein